MEIKLNIYEEDKPDLMLSWEIRDGFEESIINSVFGQDNSILAQRYGSSIRLTKMDKDLEVLIERYFKDKEDKTPPQKESKR